MSREDSSVDERFYTPRASANSSRSQRSNHSQSSFATPRSLASARSISSSSGSESYRTPRSTLRSPVGSTVPVQRVHSRRDRSKDLRRFSDKGSFSRRSSYNNRGRIVSSPGTSANRHGEYDHAENGELRRREPQQVNIFSLARHGRAGEIEEMLLRGHPVDSKDESGNSILAIGCQNGNKKVRACN